MKNQFLTKVSRGASKAGFALKKHSPEILIAIGTVGVVTSTVLACKATLKASAVLDEFHSDLDDIHEVQEAIENGDIDPEKYSLADVKKDTAIAYRDAAIGFTKLYAPAVILGILSLTCVFTSNNILRKRSAALAAAYATVDTAFKEYRGRVVDRFGKDVDFELKNGVSYEKVEKTIVDENGKEKKVKETVAVIDPNAPSEYSQLFQRTNDFWQLDDDQSDNFTAMEMWLQAQQNYVNDLLVLKGHITLNEVYERLGFEDTPTGMVVGWVYDPENGQDGDGYIEFSPKKVSFRNENDMMDTGFILDFNVDGNIYDVLKRKNK